MTTEEGDRTIGTRLVSDVRDRIGARTFVLVFVGVLAGYGIGVIGKDAVVAPVVGAVPGPLVGTVGLLVALGVYSRTSCCENCDQRTLGFGSDCGCADDCGDSCSYEP